MVVYVQIGKQPRMAINGSVKEIRDDFIKQMPKFKKLAPVYFYKSNKPTADLIGILIPYRWRADSNGRVYTYFYWSTSMGEWYIDSYDGRLSKVDYRTYGYKEYTKIVKMYEERGYEIW